MERKTNIIGYPIVIILTALITYFCFNKTKVDKGAYPAIAEPQNIIDFNQIKEFYSRYDGRAELIEEAERPVVPGFKAARAITFDYQELKNYLKEIEDNSVAAKVRIKGLRFYFGKFPNDTTGNKKARQMLFFNPTIDTIIAGNTRSVELAYAIKIQGNKTSVKFLKDIIKLPKKEPKADSLKQQVYQESEASALSFLNFSLSQDYILESQAEDGGQQSPPPSDMQ